MIARQRIPIPDLTHMTDEQVKEWLSTLSNDQVYANFSQINHALMQRFGPSARVTLSTYQKPRLIYVL